MIDGTTLKYSGEATYVIFSYFFLSDMKEKYVSTNSHVHFLLCLM